MPRSPGDEVGITYDWRGAEDKAPEVGDVLRSSRTCYLITECRRVKSDVHPHRLAIKAVVINCDEVYQAKVFELKWSPRGPRGPSADSK